MRFPDAGQSFSSWRSQKAWLHPIVHEFDATAERIDLQTRGIRSILWATGFRRKYPWLKVPVLDRHGEPLAGLMEIPNDNLDNRRIRTEPASGAAGSLLGEPIGSVSGQTLADANLLRLELIYGVRLAVPVITVNPTRSARRSASMS